MTRTKLGEAQPWLADFSEAELDQADLSKVACDSARDQKKAVLSDAHLEVKNPATRLSRVGNASRRGIHRDG